MFVRPHHKQRFRQMCQDLTGSGGSEESEVLLLPAKEGPSLGLEGSSRTVEDRETQDKAGSSIPGLRCSLYWHWHADLTARLSPSLSNKNTV